MSMLHKLGDRAVWDTFYDRKLEQGNLCDDEAEALRRFIDEEQYLPVVRRLLGGESLSDPTKMLINKSKVGRKRTVYTFPCEENYVLKLLSFLLRDYDGLFAPNLYSFRAHAGVKKATEDILRIRSLNDRYVYKADIHDYFNSVDTDLLLPELEKIFSDDPMLFRFFKNLLQNPYVLYNGERIAERKGIMAGVPTSAFLANVYLRGLDELFHQQRIPYARYSDDILVFADSEETLHDAVDTIRRTLAARRLTVNPDKESVSAPGEPWTFLGFSYHRGVIDVSDVTVEKLKGKMRRKTNALARWAGKKGLPGTYAARALIKRFNTKLYDNPVHNELTWTRWFFPVINTADSLKCIDAYMQDCLRYLVSGKRTKARYNVRYDDLKQLGYRSLVHEYYAFKKTAQDE